MATIDVERFLTNLGIDGINRVGSEVFFLCPFHGDRNPSASMKVGSGLWFCFVCHKGGTAATFLADYSGVAPIEAARKIREMADAMPVAPVKGTLLSEIDLYFANLTRTQIARMSPQERMIIENWRIAFAVDWDMTLVYLAMGGDVGDLVYPFRRGFLPTTLTDYDIGYDVLGRRLTITMRDYDGNVVGFKGRDVTGGATAKYLILGTSGGSAYGFVPYKAGDHVYLLDSCVADDVPIIVCEGELNALMMRQYGHASAIAISGSHMTERQARQILTKARREIVLFFDDDEAGRRGSARAARLFEQTLRVLVVGEHQGDPASMNYDEIDALLKCARSSLTF
jgi:DNA primase